MILAAGLSPAWQQIVLLDQLHLDSVNRVREVHWCAAGKVVNVGLALHQLGAQAKTLSIAGGPTGAALRQEVAQSGLPARWIESSRPTRICTTLLETASRTTTELVEPSPPISLPELDSFRAAFAEEAGAARLIVVSGSLPDGTSPTLYEELLRGLPARVILDLRGPELLRALAARPFLVKPNLDELARTCGHPLSTEGELVRAMFELNAQGAQWVVITRGPAPILATHQRQAFALHPPRPEHLVNPIGSGDCLAAGIAWGLWRGKPPLDALRYGMAAAARSLATLRPARLDRPPTEEEAAQIPVQEIRG